MARNVEHSLLKNAKKNKKDEFYTLRADIEQELQHYTSHFKDKVVYCNCDDPKSSNFFNYFADNFSSLGLKKLITACYKHDDQEPGQSQEIAYGLEYTVREAGEPAESVITHFRGNGDFRSQESIDLLNQADIVVTNPPFSLFRAYIDQLISFNKKFLVIANINAITYKEIFKLIQQNKTWLGIHLGRGISGFIVPAHYELYGTEARIDGLGNRIISPNNCLWLTNLDNAKRHEDIVLSKKYYGNETAYPSYDNYDGINVNKTQDIPMDFGGAMGVPITFLHKFNPDQFELIKFRKGDDDRDLRINGKSPYFRILIRNKRLGTK
ncbi:adenine-specific methyltransferase EcoRI family protein [Pedobacter jeongneungensis]|uniref:Adenine-specific methyltransferase EcoRI family protein n=1 Tax=Pedobacter jeongneungensis TaxID=947309 RepID=A0ABP8BPZ0_9SPHI